jgi:ribonuclease HII
MLTLPPIDCITVYCDEVGRGSLIYDVVAAAVIMPCEYDEDDDKVGMIKDSKKCTHKKLLELSEYIKGKAIAWGVGVASVEEIDEHNILNATMMAMHRALDDVYKQVAFDNIVVDGNRFKVYMTPEDCDGDANFVPHKCIVGGDASELGIAAASILAKVHRDTCVEALAEECEDYKTLYKWNTNKGYGTKDHIEALMKHGPTRYHRMSFKPVGESARLHMKNNTSY